MAADVTQNGSRVIPFDNLESFYDEPGEHGWIMEGYKHGFSLSTALVSSTAPSGGPPLHTHNTEEIHVLPACRLAYTIADSVFEVEGPCLVNIPAHAPHTFLNIGSEPVSVVCFWPFNDFWNNYDELGPNPLLERYGVSARTAATDTSA